MYFQARQEQKDKELEEKRIKLNDEKQKQTKTNGKLGKLKKQREQQHAREEEQRLVLGLKSEVKRKVAHLQ